MTEPTVLLSGRHAQRRRRLVFAVVAMSALVATACGSDSEEPVRNASQDEQEAAATDEPIRLGFMWEIMGESPQAVSEFQFAAEMAIADLEADAPADARPIESFRLPTSIADPQKVTAAILEASEKDPTILIGFPGQLIAGQTRTLDSVGIPVIAISPPSPGLLAGAGASDWIFKILPPGIAQGEVAARFATEHLGVTDLAEIHADEANSKSIAESFARVAEEGGGEVSVSRSTSATATDFTKEVIAASKAGAIGVFNFPAQLAVVLKQMQQANIDAPILSASSGALVAAYKLVEASAMERLYTVVACSPEGDKAERMSAFYDAYLEKHGVAPTATAASTYDAVYVAVAAARAAESNDPEAIKEQLLSGTFDQGICQPDYKADGAQVLGHKLEAISLAGGVEEVVKSYTVDPLPRQG